jgi:hypothetical protein
MLMAVEINGKITPSFQHAIIPKRLYRKTGIKIHKAHMLVCAAKGNIS